MVLVMIMTQEKGKHWGDNIPNTLKLCEMCCKSSRKYAYLCGIPRWLRTIFLFRIFQRFYSEHVRNSTFSKSMFDFTFFGTGGGRGKQMKDSLILSITSWSIVFSTILWPCISVILKKLCGKTITLHYSFLDNHCVCYFLVWSKPSRCNSCWKNMNWYDDWFIVSP